MTSIGQLLGNGRRQVPSGCQRLCVGGVQGIAGVWSPAWEGTHEWYFSIRGLQNTKLPHGAQRRGAVKIEVGGGNGTWEVGSRSEKTGKPELLAPEIGPG